MYLSAGDNYSHMWWSLLKRQIFLESDALAAARCMLGSSNYDRSSDTDAYGFESGGRMENEQFRDAQMGIFWTSADRFLCKSDWSQRLFRPAFATERDGLTWLPTRARREAERALVSFIPLINISLITWVWRNECLILFTSHKLETSMHWETFLSSYRKAQQQDIINNSVYASPIQAHLWSLLEPFSHAWRCLLHVTLANNFDRLPSFLELKIFELWCNKVELLCSKSRNDAMRVWLIDFASLMRILV